MGFEEFIDSFEGKKFLFFVGLCLILTAVSIGIHSFILANLSYNAIFFHCGFYPPQTPFWFMSWNKSNQSWEAYSFDEEVFACPSPTPCVC